MSSHLHKTIKIGKKSINAYFIKLHSKNLIILVGQNGYIMCGYLNLKVANKFKDVAVKVTGVTTISDVLKSKVQSCSFAAKKFGISKGQNIKDVLKIIV